MCHMSYGRQVMVASIYSYTLPSSGSGSGLRPQVVSAGEG